MEEENSQEWKDLRARVDTLSNSIFLLSSGAISFSATALINAKSSEHINIISSTQDNAVISWYLLLGSIILFVLLKTHLVVQAYARLNNLKWYSNVLITNKIGWGLGSLGLSLFFAGLVMLVRISAQVLNA
ncbi:hypothetical protein [Lacimicrobium alkaliphilum]|uniref:DUF202 domain-containing protein n=1 Tax=Lacimicrobium alkaliphilum TaxID=1526571 RepID=A0ABQ1RCQ4_9ALTE|nr:hypothetical protein [Lacimicrobium alkaliphilum]GGD62821.1 hypothetical protein GCM10011357_17640 [Lacimicrobium alkaliphilum]